MSSSNSGKTFIEQTKYHNLGLSEQERGLPEPISRRKFKDKNSIILPAIQTIKCSFLPLKVAVDNRVSLREYAKKPLSLNELSYLLWSCQGIKKITPEGQVHKTVPSAGARHAIDTYIFTNYVADTEQTVYYFDAVCNKLFPLFMPSAANNIMNKLFIALLRQKFIKQAAAIFIWVANPGRMTWRYQERGYRYLFLDAGHICQNLYLAAETIDSGACAIASFLDDAVNELLLIDGENQFTIYLAAVGKKPHLKC